MQSRALPIEQMQAAAGPIEENVIGIQVRMAKPCGVKPREGHTDLASDSPALCRLLLLAQRLTQLCSRYFAYQQESSPLSILAGRQPLRCADALALQNLEHSSFAQGAGYETEAGQSVFQAGTPGDAMLALKVSNP